MSGQSVHSCREERIDPTITPIAERLFDLVARFRGPRPPHSAREGTPEDQELHRQAHGQMRMLVTLLRDGPLTVQDLARALDVSAPTASVLAKKAFEDRLIERRRDEGDSRIVWLEIAPAGRARVEAHRADRVRRFERLIADREDIDRADLAQAVAVLSELFAPPSAEDRPVGDSLETSRHNHAFGRAVEDGV